jgi:TPR repeat protein/tRNA A-37 threonylcarbamoyl transferase component Bud32
MLTPGTVVGGDYRIERALSEGGMGAVFVAEQQSTGAMRALKIIKSELLVDPKLRQRFEQEAKVTAKIASDHVVSVVAAGIDRDLNLPWIAMELLKGQTLADFVKQRGALPTDAAIAVLTQLAHAIDAAHEVGVVHRDLKPENIFLAESRRAGASFFVKVLDFGIARIVREAQVTKTDSLGTPLWMSPEQAGSGESVGPWTDIWSFGLIVFYLLTGRPYWLSAQEGGTPLSLVKEVCMDPLAQASERAKALGCEVGLGPGFDAWFAECVARDTNKRTKSAGKALSTLRVALGLPADDRALAATSFPLSSSDDSSTRGAADGTAKTELAIDTGSTSKPDVSTDAKDKAVAAASATPSGVVTTKKSAGVEPPPKEKKTSSYVKLGVLAALAVVVVTGGWRKMKALDDEQARVGLWSKSPANFQKAADVIRASCNNGDVDACALLGNRLAFPLSPQIKRDVPGAVELLTRACDAGRGCAMLGTLRELGTPGVTKDVAHYFDGACTSNKGGAVERLSCAFALAHALEGPKGKSLPEELAPQARGLSMRDECDSDPDACGLGWLTLEQGSADLRKLYERGCDAGSSLACNNLGTFQAEGIAGLEANPTLARERFQAACDAGEAAACNNLGFVAGGFVATVRNGPRGALVYKLRCSGPFQVGCAGWGDSVKTVPAGTPVNATDAAAAFQRACDAGLTTACVNLGALVYIGRGVTRDRARAEKLFADTCFRGDPSACGEQGSALVTVRMDHPRDVRGGFGFLERACKGGEKDACIAIGTMMLNSTPDRGREAEGAKTLLKLRDEGVYSHDLVQMFETGADGIDKNEKLARDLALQWCQRDSRCPDAAYYLQRGIGGPKEESRSIDLLVRGCDNDDLVSCTELGQEYMDGHLVGKDPTRAVSLFKKACDEGEPDGCDRLGTAYASGNGAPKDPARALALERDACESGLPTACATYGIMMADGVGTDANVDAAVPYLAFACRRAAMKSCAKLTALKKPVPELDL